MKKIETFEDLGRDYSLNLLNEIITDHTFGLTVISIIEPKFFPANAFAKIAHLIKNYYLKHDCLLNFPGLRAEANLNIVTTGDDNTFKTQILDTIDAIEKCNVGNLNIQESAKKFCKLQSLKTAVNAIKVKLDRGILDDYDTIEETLKNAMTFREVTDPIELDFDMENVLSDDYRDPIRTGINGVDDNTGGGISKGEFTLLIAAMGVGKSTWLSYIANTAYEEEGRNVLHVFFEDKLKDVQRKHYTKMSGIPLSEIKYNKEEVLSVVKEKTKKLKNHLWLLKLPSTGTTLKVIKNEIKRLNSKGTKVEVLVLDYIDCICSDVNIGTEEWSNEGAIMREFESLIEEMNVAGHTATQGGRCIFVGEKVITNRGIICIGDININDLVLTHKGFKPVTNIYPKEIKTTYKIKTKSGKTIIVSEKHIFPVGDGKYKSILSGLSVGDKLLTKK